MYTHPPPPSKRFRCLPLPDADQLGQRRIMLLLDAAVYTGKLSPHLLTNNFIETTHQQTKFSELHNDHTETRGHVPGADDAYSL